MEASGGSSLVFRGCELPPGFRFQPTDQEIILCYLKKKMAAAAAVTSIIADVDIYKFDPWELPGKAVFGEGEWFFFSPRDRKYPNGARPNRTAGSGYWKATGTDKPILGQGARCLGVKKALVFYQGRSPKGAKTQWVMHEYRLLIDAAAATATSCSSNNSNSNSMRLDDWVLCRVRNKDYYSSSFSEQQQPPPPPNNINIRDDLSVPDDNSAGHGALVSILESIKRNLSFQAIDELCLLQQRPAKRPNYGMARAAGEDAHHTFFSISEDDDDRLFF
ncbi:unnamed protein product [Urochloa humidicola]